MIQQPSILIDTTRCSGCETCVAACKKANGLGPDRPWRGQASIDGLSSTRYSTILRRPGRHYVRQQCRHCLEPACVSACLVGAMRKSPEGPVVYDASLCMGCRYCMMACPYDIPRYDWDRAAPEIRKCTMCYARLADDKEPACVEACPEKALAFGTRDAMLAEAGRRIAAQPETYLPTIRGEREVGGTSVLYVSDIPLDFLGAKANLGERPRPELTWAALKKVPGVVLGMGGLMTGIYWIVGRRMRLAAHAGEAKGPETKPETGAREADHE